MSKINKQLLSRLYVTPYNLYLEGNGFPIMSLRDMEGPYFAFKK
jgi:hypothetical protein